MEADTATASSQRCSPEAPSRRVPVSSLLNSATIDEPVKTEPCRSSSITDGGDSEPNDSGHEDFDETSPESDEHYHSNDPNQSKHPLRRLGPTPARLRKKQWTHEHVRRLQQLYKEDQRWEVIAEKLGRSAVACKLKHNKELRKKSNVALPISHEGIYACPGPHQLVSEALSAISALKRQISDDGPAMKSRIHYSVAEAFSNMGRQLSQSNWTDARRASGDTAALLDHLQNQLSWEITSALAREQQLVSNVWAAVVQLQNQTVVGPPSLPYRLPPRC